jgi:Spy/CpxP family protein refolding chaperone
MNKSLSKALLGAVVAGAALLSLSVASWSMDHGGGMDFDPGRMVAHMTDRLDLTEEQASSVKQLTTAAKERLTADRKRLQELREQLKAQRDDFDAGKAQVMADEIGEITSRMVFQAVSTHAEIYQLLTDEQKEEMDTMMEQRESRRDHWRQGGKKPRE